MLDQLGGFIETSAARVTLALRFGENSTMDPMATLSVAPQPAAAWCGAAMGGWCPDTVAHTDRGRASFGGITLQRIGAGVHFEVAVEGLGAARTNTTYTVVLGPARKKVESSFGAFARPPAL